MQEVQRDPETIDEILSGGLRIIQPRRGYRFSIDALLLAHFAAARPDDEAADLGSGCGIIALIMACRCRRVLGVDIQPQQVALSRSNAALNGLEGRVDFREADVRAPETIGPPGSFDLVLFNPPYRRLRSGRINPDPAKALARHELAGGVADFIAAAAYLLREKGRAVTIYPSVRMAEVITRMREFRLEPKRMRLVHSRPGSRAEFVLLEGVRGGREGLAVAPPLFLYRAGQVYSEEAESIFAELSGWPAAYRSPSS